MALDCEFFGPLIYLYDHWGILKGVDKLPRCSSGYGRGDSSDLNWVPHSFDPLFGQQATLVFFDFIFLRRLFNDERTWASFLIEAIDA